MAFHVAIIGDAGKVWVGHANFFALIDIRRPLHTVQRHRQHFRGWNPVFTLVAKAGNDARLIVITPE
ncbi:Uncharacterised protein [Salmonella enterica subsp. enterica serovar Bovismorbificans]|nr:Uncharacterised protein [Salmonella enterica subsp. enterica serovar Bovismorbificans]